MPTRRHKKSKCTIKGGKKTFKNKGKKHWTTAIIAAQKTLKKTGSLGKAREKLKSQALINARKLFGSVGEQM